ncbi:sensor domain-containing diguanylate cyclase [Bordetella holmesii]|uniref:diguanylate cyclase n=4 Tax=Bordetella holmesii TaxID=35814 RepID=A0A158M764_9BORD|nr:sensor domain-containing diguanylate cyclase [Bordetella holmesii]AHV94245.1 diguanylate cyclase domain protein [Bordetella holmesii ATCC 51541]AIT27099.1 diguanylate cyclase domain protein [Bordetella holmesii 44057]EWM43722.1 diguanylate cyclase domain protein [Bordetella holmesii 41130]EWM47682.1 diguanylate cyclase domain protein [Bordetella holmesii 35009]AMD45991.1 histidine kinase [Bordetella holmesii H558]
MRRLDLRRLILGLSILSLLLAMAGALYASSVVQREILVGSSLEDNRAFAQKLARSADIFLRESLTELAYSARLIGREGGTEQSVQREVERLKNQSGNFNATAFVNADGVIAGITPAEPGVAGRQVSTNAMEQALASRLPRISEPFLSPGGRWIVAISQPVFLPDGRFGGFIMGLLYLHERNALGEILGEQTHRNGAYQYVVDQRGILLFHPNLRSVGQIVDQNAAVHELMLGQEGAQRIVNTEGVDMLSGYALLRETGWGVVAQRPTDGVLSRTQVLLLRTIQTSLPWLCLSLLCVWWLANRIARPLAQLAGAAADLDKPRVADRLAGVGAWYREAEQLKTALGAVSRKIGTKFNQLRQDSLTDALTGLLNRRGLDEILQSEPRYGRAMAVLAVDIDHFKSINDGLGHAAGDAVIRGIAALLRSRARASDMLGRLGGEEFVVILPNTDRPQALQAAERIRAAVETFQAVPGGACTVSVGVAVYPHEGASLTEVLARADDALYEAKRGGRNRVCDAASM